MANIDPNYFNLSKFFDKEENDENLIKNYITHCGLVRRGTNFDIRKCFLEGKALIIEGHHIIPNMYLKNNNGNLQIFTPNPEEFQKVMMAVLNKTSKGKKQRKGCPFRNAKFNEKRNNYTNFINNKRKRPFEIY